eukprot:14205276-Ditylum_brightwellii.AAC.1
MYKDDAAAAAAAAEGDKYEGGVATQTEGKDVPSLLFSSLLPSSSFVVQPSHEDSDNEDIDFISFILFPSLRVSALVCFDEK